MTHFSFLPGIICLYIIFLNFIYFSRNVCMCITFALYSVFYLYIWTFVRNILIILYSGTSLLRSPTGLGKNDLNGDVTLLQGGYLHCGIQFGTARG